MSGSAGSRSSTTRRSFTVSPRQLRSGECAEFPYGFGDSSSQGFDQGDLLANFHPAVRAQEFQYAINRPAVLNRNPHSADETGGFREQRPRQRHVLHEVYRQEAASLGPRPSNHSFSRARAPAE